MTRLHRRLLAGLAVFFGLYFSLRTSRALMNRLWYGAVLPLEQSLARLCGRLSLSVGEVLIVTGVCVAILWLANVLRRLCTRPKPLHTLWSSFLTALCAVAVVYALFCALWGIGYNTDGFQEKSGLTARPATVETLTYVTALFADGAVACADSVPRDETGVCALDRSAVLSRSGSALDALCEEFPFLAMEGTPVKPFVCSRALSVLRFTGFYFPFTGEANVNTDSPAAFLPATVCHELAHQRGLTAEEECTFVGILAALRSQDVSCRYSGWLTGFRYLFNALSTADADACQTIWDGLPDTVRADLLDNVTYWAQFQGTVSLTANRVYDTFLKSNGDSDGVHSYGTVTDLLTVYFG